MLCVELETKVHPKVSNHGEGPYTGLLRDYEPSDRPSCQALVVLCGGRWGSGSTAWTRPSSPSSRWRPAGTRGSSSSGWSRGPSWRSWADHHTRTNKNIYTYLLSSEYILLALLLINCICLRKSVTLISLSLEMLRWGREVTV